MEWLVGLGAVVSWMLLWLLSAGIITIVFVGVAQKVEHFLVISDRWTFPLWILGLSLTPACAFFGNWILWGLIVSERLYLPVRMGSLVAGFGFAVGGVLLVMRPGKREDQDRAEELLTLLGSLLVDALFCAALVWYFAPIANFMRAIGQG